MRIAHVITRMIVGGAQENTLLNCLDLMRDYHDDVLLVTGPALGPEGDLLSQGRAGELPVALLPRVRRPIHPRDCLAYRDIKATLRAFRPDVVHTHSAKAGLLGRAAAFSLDVPAIIHSVHGAPFHPFQPAVAREFFRHCEAWAARRCHRLISVADAMTDLMVKSKVAPREKFTTIYSGMEVQPFWEAETRREETRANYGFSEEHVVIGKIARLFHLKGHEDLITSAVDVVRRVPNVRFLLVGDGVLRAELEARIEERSLSKHFVFAGLVPPSKVPDLIGAMDLLVHTSYREGLARALPQALIAGRPVVSYDVDGAREVAITGKTGILVPPMNTEALSEALLELASDGRLRARYGQCGRALFTDQFRHQTMTRQIREVYKHVLRTDQRPK